MGAAAVVTLLFTDIVGSTDLYQRLGDEEAEKIRRGHFRLLRDAVVSVGGREVKNLGDGLMVVFESPHEAVSCAVAMQQAVQRHQSADQLAVRVGLHVGEPIREEEDFFGTPVATAKRLCDAADGGQIYASELVRALVGSRGTFEFESVGDLELKGLSEPIRTFKVAWAPAEAARLPLPAQLDVPERVGLVGRSADLDTLKTALKQAAAGQVRVVLLAGEPGIGKTRLASEFARWAHGEGATVLLGRCDEEPLAAYQPVVEALGRYVRAASTDDLRANTGRHAPTLAQLVPDVRERLPGLPEPLSGDPETERTRIFDAITTILHGLARSAPVVVFFDDVHWAQQPLLLLLRHLLRDADPAGLLLIATYRDTELDRKHPLSEMLAEFRRYDEEVSRVALRGLDLDGVVAFMEGASGHDLDDEALALARSLHETTEGNPFFLREVLRHLTETGALTLEDGRWVGSRPAADIGLPEGVKEVIGRRLSQLSADSNKILRMAAVIGREFDLQLLVEISGAGWEPTLTLVEEGIAARVVVEVPGAVDRFSFAHALVRETLLDELTTSRRVRLHRSLAEAIERIHAGDIDEHLSELAYHFGEAADTDLERAIEYARQAGQAATELHSYEEAAGHFERALDWLDATGGDDPRLHCELLIGLSTVQVRSIGQDTARETIRAAVEPARALGDQDLFTRVVLAFAGRYGVPGMANADVVGFIEEALAMLDESQAAHRGGLLSRLAMELMLIDPQRSADLATESLRLADVHGDPYLRAHAIWIYGWTVAADNADPVEWRRLAADLHRHGLEGGDAWVGVAGRWFEIYSCLLVGDMDGAKQAFAAYLSEAREYRVIQGRYFEKLGGGLFALLEGRIDEAEVLIHEALAIGQENQDPLVMNQYGVQVLILRWLQGRAEELVPMLDTLRTTDPHVPWWIALALCQAMSGQHEEARATYEHGIAGGIESNIQRDPNRIAALGTLTIVCWMLNDTARAAELYELNEPMDGKNVVIGVPGAVALAGAHQLAMLAALLGRWDDHERHVADAYAMYEKMGDPPWRVLLDGSTAVDLLRRGRPEDVARARDLLARAKEDGHAKGYNIEAILTPVMNEVRSHL
jgi:class 3 adenylate cyclase/tetratricopeptide (TPR) repeat protein